MDSITNGEAEHASAFMGTSKHLNRVNIAWLQYANIKYMWPIRLLTMLFYNGHTWNRQQYFIYPQNDD